MSMSRPKGLTVCVWLVPLMIAVPTGCKSDEKKISEASHLLARQHEAWAVALEGCKRGQADLGRLRTVGEYLIQRTAARVEIDYTGANKQEVVALLKELGRTYNETVLSKIVPTQDAFALREGVTNEDLCKAFLAMEGRYQKLVEMTRE